MNLEVGMYCFNKTNRKLGIGKILTEPTKYNNVVIEFKNGITVVSSGNVVASHNIKELIEAGDIVVFINNSYKEELLLIRNSYYEIDILNTYKIKSIVTKEQFESMQYKVD